MRETEEKSRKFAKILRRRMTNAEVILSCLRQGSHGVRFRRQHPIGPYIADFACVSLKLVLEVDGATHGSEAEMCYDVQREKHLRRLGWRVLRVTNEDVYRNLDGVWRAIAQALKVPPPVRSADAREPPPP